MSLQPPRFNPFPGLRHFKSDEDYLFFGRAGQSDEVLRRLLLQRLLAVLGSSGSGKSSLIRAGLIPSLRRTASHWRVAVFRPGDDPIANLAAAISAPQVLGSAGEGDDASTAALWMQTTLRQSAVGLIEAVRLTRLPESDNVLIIVDQFEELFRFAGVGDHPGREDDAAAFVKLLLEATTQTDLPIYVVITLRSDFIGDCTRFRDLPETVNSGLYLIPRMTRGQRREAIVGPVAVERGEIAPRLVNRLLNDVGDAPDQLPALQHALMRTWDYWVANRTLDEPIDLRHYEAIGGIASALSRHADEVYDGLPSQRARDIARILFLCLSEKGADNREVRRPTKVSEIAAVAGADISDVIAIVESFRQPGCSFLMPPSEIPLREGTVIDISHESLIRGWERLKDWVKEETNSAATYSRLADAAAQHELGNAGLLRDPALQVALDWRDRQLPNEAWARRYHSGFLAAMRFLDASKSAREDEARREEELRAADLSRARRNLATVSALLICALAAFVLSGYLGFRSHRWNLALKEEKAHLANANKTTEEALAAVRSENQVANAMSQQLETKNQALQEQTDRANTLLREEQHQADIARRNEKAARADEKTAVDFANDTVEEFFNMPQSVKAESAVSASNKLLLSEAISLSEQVLGNDPTNLGAEELRVISRASKVDLELAHDRREAFLKDCRENLATGENLAARRDSYMYRVLGATLIASTAQSMMNADKSDTQALDAASRAAQIADEVRPSIPANNSTYWFYMGFTFSAVAAVYRTHAKSIEAQQSFQKAVEARKQRIVAAEPKFSQSDVDRVLGSLKDLANLQKAQEDTGGRRKANATYTDAISYAEKYLNASTTPANQQYFVDRLFWQYLNRGDSLEEWKDYDAAGQDYASAAKLLDDTRFDPDDKRFDSYAVRIRQGNLLYALATLPEMSPRAMVQKRESLLHEALQYHQQALNSASLSPASNEDLSQHENCYYSIGRDYLALADLQRARQNYQDAVKDLTAAATKPSDNQLRRRIAGSHELHTLSEQIEDYAAAKQELDLEIESLTPLVNRDDPSAGDVSDLVGAYGSRSFVDIFLGQFDAAISDSAEALKLDPTQLWILTNQAHGYLFSGDMLQARNIYLCHQKDKVFSATFADAVLGDFKQLRQSKAFQSLPGFDEKLHAMDDIEKALATKQPCPSSSSDSETLISSK
jgi:hypothetical protein